MGRGPWYTDWELEEELGVMKHTIWAKDRGVWGQRYPAIGRRVYNCKAMPASAMLHTIYAFLCNYHIRTWILNVHYTRPP